MTLHIFVKLFSIIFTKDASQSLLRRPISLLMPVTSVDRKGYGPLRSRSDAPSELPPFLTPLAAATYIQVDSIVQTSSSGAKADDCLMFHTATSFSEEQERVSLICCNNSNLQGGTNFRLSGIGLQAAQRFVRPIHYPNTFPLCSIPPLYDDNHIVTFLFPECYSTLPYLIQKKSQD